LVYILSQEVVSDYRPHLCFGFNGEVDYNINMKKVLFIFGSGGHSAESLILLKQMGPNYKYEFMLENDDPFSKKKLDGHKVYEATTIRGKKEVFAVTALRILMCTLQSIIIFVKSNPDVIISAGPGIAIPISYIGKLFGKKIIFIESWSRVETRSIAGKLIYPIADQFYIQWPDLQTAYPKAIFKGRLG